jgi:hypothetical protein
MSEYTKLEIFEHYACVKMISLIYDSNFKPRDTPRAPIYSKFAIQEFVKFGDQNKKRLTSTTENRIIIHEDSFFDLPNTFGKLDEFYSSTFEISCKNLLKLNSKFKNIDDLYEHFDIGCKFDYNPQLSSTNIKNLSYSADKFELYNLINNNTFKEIFENNTQTF